MIPKEVTGNPVGKPPKPIPNPGGKKKLDCFKAPHSKLYCEMLIKDVEAYCADWGIPVRDFMREGVFEINYKMATVFGGINPPPSLPPKFRTEPVEATEKIIKSDKKLKGNKLGTEAVTANPKEELLKRKIRKEIEGEKVGDAVKSLVSAYTTFDVSGIEDVPFWIQKMTFNDVFLWDALVRLSRVSDCRFYIDEAGVFHFFESGTHFPVYFEGIRTSPYGKTEVAKGSAELVGDKSKLRNRIQVFGAEENSPKYVEEFVGDGYQTEYGLSYTPRWCTVRVSLDGLDCSVWQDWGVRDWLSVSEPTIPCVLAMEAPNCYVNLERGWLRFSAPPPNGSIIRVEYIFTAPLYIVVQDPVSIAKLGLHESILCAPEKLSTWEMEHLAMAILREFSQPRETLSVRLFNIYDLKIGDSVNVFIPELGLENEKWSVFSIEKSWDLNERGTAEDVQLLHTVRLGAMPHESPEEFAELAARVSALERRYFLVDAPPKYGYILKERIEVNDEVIGRFIEGVARVGVARVGQAWL